MVSSLVNALRVVLQLGVRAPAPYCDVVYGALTQLARRGAARTAAADAEDAVHEVYLALLRGGREFKGTSEGQARAFLQTAIERQRIDEHRRASRLGSVASQMPSSLASSDDVALARSFCSLLKHFAALAASAPPRLRVDRVIEQLDELGLLPWTARAHLGDEALAHSLGISRAALHTRRRRLRNRLLQLVAEAELEPEDRRMLATLLAP